MFFMPFNQALYATQHSRINPPFGNAVAAMRKPALPQCGKAVIISSMVEDGKKTGPESVPQVSVEDLAKRLMDLWQEQMAAIAADPDLMRQMAQMMAASPFPAMMQGIMQGILASAAQPGAQNPYEWWKADGPKPSAEARPAQAGAATAAAASQPGGGDLAELRRNLAGLEARLAELGGSPGSRERAGGPATQLKPKSPAPKRPARKSPKAVAGSAGGGGGSGTGGSGGGAAG
jgi:hypothetical protein